MVPGPDHQLQREGIVRRFLQGEGVTLALQIGGNVLPGAGIGQPDGEGLTGFGLPQPELEPDQRLGATPGGQVEVFHGGSIARDGGYYGRDESTKQRL